MLRPELLPSAERDYEESYAWYLERSERAALRFEEVIHDTIHRLCNSPSLGTRIDQKHYFYRIKKSYPFYLVYRTEATKLVIVAIAHKSRRPDYWRAR